jgi:hypothetical protein
MTTLILNFNFYLLKPMRKLVRKRLPTKSLNSVSVQWMEETGKTLQTEPFQLNQVSAEACRLKADRLCWSTKD